MKDSLCVGDSVFNSPVGSGEVTGVSDAGYPQVNQVTVARLVHKTKYGKFMAFDPWGTYAKGDWSLFLVNKSFPVRDVADSAAVLHSTKEAIDFCNAVKSLPKSITLDHDLGNESSIAFVNWMIEQLHVGNPVFKISQDFKYAVHCPDSNGAKIIKALLDPVVNRFKES